ncbi:sugar kinase [Ferrovibrio sp.]|uniref:sugar kinase n=1 Tax=Ferrovibrio sp. TaxID=1917215 RepID=UPI001B6B550A|nr:sugar kinase [Ferrovibrio sp.]MBP7066103.1 sugar kinase [Ferrovibrio sp.]
MRLDILCLGEAMVEFNQTNGPESDQYLRDFGGDTSNCAIAAARQGARAGYATLVGSDPFGDLLLGLWQREGVDSANVGRRADAPTGIYFVTHSGQGHTFTYYRKGSAASTMLPADLPAERVAEATILHTSGISLGVSAALRETTFAAMTAARQAGTRVAFDTNLRLKLWPLEQARTETHRAAKLADILLPSLEDARALSGLDQPEAILDFYRGLGVPLVVLKCGAAGVLLGTPDGARWRVPGHSVPSVDATGAGDCFDGAFLAEIARGAAPTEAAAYANTAAALTTIGYGAVGPIPRRAAVEAFFRSVGSPKPAAF